MAQGVDPKDVWAQSFNVEDVYYWIDHEPAFGEQAVFLDDVDSEADLEAAIDDFSEMRKRGVRIVAPPLWTLVAEKNGQIVPSRYAKKARKSGFDLITWTLERSGPLVSGGGWYFQSVADLTDDDGVTFEILDVLAHDVEVVGVFSDWPATVTYYANCFGL